MWSTPFINCDFGNCLPSFISSSIQNVGPHVKRACNQGINGHKIMGSRYLCCMPKTHEYISTPFFPKESALRAEVLLSLITRYRAFVFIAGRLAVERTSWPHSDSRLIWVVHYVKLRS